MTFVSTLQDGMVVVKNSRVVHDTINVGYAFIVVVCILLILVSITFLLRRFFRNHEVNRIHRILIYLLTMAGILALVIAGILGALLPLLPGIPFFIAALLLMRKYHKWQWLETQIKKVKIFYRKEYRNVQAKVNKRRNVAKRK
jgi:type III secretory pathway component EscV